MSPGTEQLVAYHLQAWLLALEDVHELNNSLRRVSDETGEAIVAAVSLLTLTPDQRVTDLAAEMIGYTGKVVKQVQVMQGRLANLIQLAEGNVHRAEAEIERAADEPGGGDHDGEH
jgi:hypothetical protein